MANVQRFIVGGVPRVIPVRGTRLIRNTGACTVWLGNDAVTPQSGYPLEVGAEVLVDSDIWAIDPGDINRPESTPASQLSGPWGGVVVVLVP